MPRREDLLSELMYDAMMNAPVRGRREDTPAAPVFSSPAAAELEEGGTAALTVVASGGTGITYAISGGADAALFGINASTGELAFLVAPDFETPLDADTDNVYEVEVTATNAEALEATQQIQVTVTDVVEVKLLRVEILSVVPNPTNPDDGALATLRLTNLDTNDHPGAPESLSVQIVSLETAFVGLSGGFVYQGEDLELPLAIDFADIGTFTIYAAVYDGAAANGYTAELSDPAIDAALGGSDLPISAPLELEVELPPLQHFRLEVLGVKYNNSNVPPSTGDVRITEFELFTGDTKYPIANFTNDTFASASSNASSFDGWKAFDGSTTDADRWISAGGASGTLPQWLQVEIEDPIDLTSYTIAPDGAVSSGYFLTEWKVWGSSDGSFSGEEHLLDHRTGVANGWHANLRRAFNVGDRPAGTAYRYFRLNITEVMSSNVQGSSSAFTARVSELQLFENKEQHPPVQMGSANTPAPYVVTSSGDTGGFPVQGAFNHVASDASRWISSTGAAFPRWIGIDLGAGNNAILTHYKIAPDGAVSSGFFLTAWQLLASNTGAFAGEEVVLDSRSGITTGWADLTLRQFTI